MSIAKPFTFVANTYAKASEVNADFDIVYSQVNTNISNIAQNAADIDNLENNKANINGSTAHRFAVADAISNGDAINKQSLMKAIGNSIDIISGFVITKDSGSPNDTILVYAGSCYDSTSTVVLSTSSNISKKNSPQSANSTYYVYVIGNATGSQTDILISTSSTTPTFPSGYTMFRRIGYFTTDSSANIDYIGFYGINNADDKSLSNIINAVMPDYSKRTTFSVSGGTIPYDCKFVFYSGSTLYDGLSGVIIKINDNIEYIVRTHDYAATTPSYVAYLPKGASVSIQTGTGTTSGYYAFIIPLKGAAL